jgi:hypothetical protein
MRILIGISSNKLHDQTIFSALNGDSSELGCELTRTVQPELDPEFPESRQRRMCTVKAVAHVKRTMVQSKPHMDQISFPANQTGMLKGRHMHRPTNGEDTNGQRNIYSRTVMQQPQHGPLTSAIVGWTWGKAERETSTSFFEMQHPIHGDNIPKI